MGTVGVQVEDLGARCLPSANEVCFDDEGGVYDVGQFQQEQSETLAQDDEDTNVIQTKMFKRRRRATAFLDGDPGRAVPPKCCDHCKSDLNGKLMVRCAMCSFCCHLYCFSPPLKQHPAFLIRRHQQKIGKHDSNDPVWKCEKCEGTSVVFNMNARPSTSVMPNRQHGNSPTKRKIDPKTELATTSTLITEEVDTHSGWVQRVQPQWIENVDGAFDWYRFRTEKAKVLRNHEAKANQNCGQVDELVFYSKAYAMMKKVAAVWRGHVIKRQRYRHNQELEAKAMSYPNVNCNVMYQPKPSEKSKAEAANNETFNKEEEDVNLVGDMGQSLYTRYSRRPPRLPLLWEGEPPSAIMCWTTTERSEVVDALVEMEEQVCLASEDFDAMEKLVVDTPEKATDIISAPPTVNNPKSVSIHTTVTIIQIVFVRHRLWRRRCDRLNRQRRALEDAERRAKARTSIALLRTCIQFIVLLVKLLGQAQKKKLMLMVLRDAAEETQLNNDTMPTEQKKNKDAAHLERERIHKLAVVRIRRFFIRRVHPYVKLKKTVMVRRLQRWWKRKLCTHKWREAAIAIRLIYRTKSCTRIQRCYRQARVRSRFRALIEKSALKRVRRALTGWLMARLAKKEAERSAAYRAALISDTDDNFIPQDAPLDEILEKRGMELFHQGDFWNAASLLERLCGMRTGILTRELQQTLAYSHHMTWYTSYDQFNLHRAHELYCGSLENVTSGERSGRVDPSILQDLAIVTMHLEYFSDSLRLLAKLVEYFARLPQFPLWLLLAAVQLQQRGEWEQSVEYLTYLHDIPPTPYSERDILALCAMGYEQLAVAPAKPTEWRTSNSMFAKEAWRAALRQSALEKVTGDEIGSVLTARTRGNGRALTARLKWELLTSLGQRALEQGHYLLACRVYIYALECEAKPSNELSPYSSYYDHEQQAAWWNLADAFRHLGHLDLYFNAAQRSQTGRSGEGEVDENVRESWRELANQQASSFETELKTLSVLAKLRQLAGDVKECDT